MARLASQAKAELPIRETALELVRSVPQKRWHGEVEAVFHFVRDQIRYTRDPHQVEMVQTPARTLSYGAGDCDDMVTLLAALLGSLGYPTRFVAIGFAPEHYQHVYLEADVGGQWVALDPTEPVGVGWRPPNAVARMTRRVD